MYDHTDGPFLKDRHVVRVDNTIQGSEMVFLPKTKVHDSILRAVGLADQGE